MAFGYPYGSNYFNTNYMPPIPGQQSLPNMMPTYQPGAAGQQNMGQSPAITPVPDELTARNAQFPMDGSIAFFSNLSNGEIYTKQLSMVDGTVIFNKYTRAADTAKNEPKYATRADLDALKNEIYAMMETATAPVNGGAQA